MAAPQSWRSPAGGASPEGAPVSDNWWQAFEDPQLDALVTRGLEANHDLALAISRVEESRALARLAGADRLPSIALEAGAARTRLSEESGVVAPGADPEIDSGRVAATVAFELDAERIEAKLKLSQNRAPADRAALLAAFDADAGAAELAALTRRVFADQAG